MSDLEAALSREWLLRKAARLEGRGLSAATVRAVHRALMAAIIEAERLERMGRLSA